MDPASFALLRDAVFHDRYRVVRCLKLGGMGAVYEVRDLKTDSARALKVMLPALVEDADFRARFALEARVTGGIESDHIVRVSDAGVDDESGAPFLVMDLLRGQELGAMLEAQGGLPAAEVVLYLHQTALALDKTHAAGIVHRDLKPENLFVTTRDDGHPCVKILDFGIAKVVAGQKSARATKAIGTPLYMSPEQVRGEGTISPRADLYALGHIAYSALVGEPYWAEEEAGYDAIFPLMVKIMAGIEEPPSARAARRKQVTLPPAFDAWFAQATAARAEDRFDRAGALVEALADALGVERPAGPRSRVALGPRHSVSTTSPTVSADDPVAHAGTGLGAADGTRPAARTGDAVTHGAPPRAARGSRIAAGATVIVALGVAAVVALQQSAPRVDPIHAASSEGVAPPPSMTASATAPSASVVVEVAAPSGSASGPAPSASAPPSAKPAGSALPLPLSRPHPPGTGKPLTPTPPVKRPSTYSQD